MAAKPSYLLKAPDEDFARWKAAAEERGISLAAFLRASANEASTSPGVASPSRTAMCEHRVPAGSFCKRCDD